MLLNAIKMNTYAARQTQIKTTNFDSVLPMTQADYANEVFESSYNLGFLGITEPVKKLELEKRLVAKISAYFATPSLILKTIHIFRTKEM